MASPSVSRAVVSLALSNDGDPAAGEMNVGVVPGVGSSGWVPLAGMLPVGIGTGVWPGTIASAGSMVPMIMRMMNSMAVDRPRVMASVWARVVKSVTGRRKRTLFSDKFNGFPSLARGAPEAAGVGESKKLLQKLRELERVKNYSPKM